MIENGCGIRQGWMPCWPGMFILPLIRNGTHASIKLPRKPIAEQYLLLLALPMKPFWKPILADRQRCEFAAGHANPFWGDGRAPFCSTVENETAAIPVDLLRLEPAAIAKSLRERAMRRLSPR